MLVTQNPPWEYSQPSEKEHNSLLPRTRRMETTSFLEAELSCLDSHVVGFIPNLFKSNQIYFYLIESIKPIKTITAKYWFIS